MGLASQQLDDQEIFLETLEHLLADHKGRKHVLQVGSVDHTEGFQ